MTERAVYILLSILAVLFVLSVNTNEVMITEGEQATIKFDLPGPIVTVESDNPDVAEVPMSICCVDNCAYTVTGHSPGLARVVATNTSGRTETYYVAVRSAKK